MNKLLISLTVCALSVMMNFAAAEEKTSCDRACLQGFVIQVLDSMKNHEASKLPLARWYLLTENGGATSPIMGTLWRTITDYKKPGMGQYVIDPGTGQIFFVADVSEGPSHSIVFGRLKVEKMYLSELELYVNRSKGEGGQIFDPDGLSRLPSAWTTPAPEAQKPNREELTRLGKTVFDRSYGDPESSDSCEMVEMGQIVMEDVEALKKLMMDKLDTTNRIRNGRSSIPCTSKARPEDKNARMIVDEEQGVTVNIATVPGVVYGSFITPGLESTFVPESLRAGFDALPAEQHDPNVKSSASSKQFIPVLRTTQVVDQTAEMTKFYGGKIQGVQRYLHIVPVGSGTPWVENPK